MRRKFSKGIFIYFSRLNLHFLLLRTKACCFEDSNHSLENMVHSIMNYFQNSGTWPTNIRRNCPQLLQHDDNVRHFYSFTFDLQPLTSTQLGGIRVRVRTNVISQLSTVYSNISKNWSTFNLSRWLGRPSNLMFITTFLIYT
mgnify:CR=1 FL=1